MKASYFITSLYLLLAQFTLAQNTSETMVMNMLSQAQQKISAGEFAAGNQLLAEIKGIVEVQRSTVALARYHSIRGYALEMEGNIQSAIAAYEEGLTIRRERGEYLDQAKLLITISTSKEKIGDHDSALSYAREAIKAAGLAEENGRYWEMHTCVSRWHTGIAGITRKPKRLTEKPGAPSTTAMTSTGSASLPITLPSCFS